MAVGGEFVGAITRIPAGSIVSNIGELALVDVAHVDTARVDTPRVDTARVDTARVDTARVDIARVDIAPGFLTSDGAKERETASRLRDTASRLRETAERGEAVTRLSGWSLPKLSNEGCGRHVD